ncbi:MAG TPA: hypothetical protein VH599_10285 [Ktedonobacterales bacterium]|jgi:hypothetical protein
MKQQLPDVIQGSRIGTWCHWGAWIIAGLGALQILIILTQNQVLPVLGVLSGTIFSALILYAVGTIVKHSVGGRPTP